MYLTALYILFSFSQELQANEKESYNHQELVDLALENNPDLKVDFHKWKSAVSAITAAHTLPDPQLTYTEFLEEFKHEAIKDEKLG